MLTPVQVKLELGVGGLYWAISWSDLKKYGLEIVLIVYIQMAVLREPFPKI